MLSIVEGRRIIEISRHHLDTVQDLQLRAFGKLQLPESLWRRRRERIMDAGRALGLFVEDGLAGAAHISDFRQWWHGRSLRMAGVGGVVVAPQYRGAGVGTDTIRALLAHAGRLGYPVAALYPSSLPLYRRFGFELAGSYEQSTFTASALHGMSPGEGITRLAQGGPDDAATLRELAAAVYASHRDSGPIELPDEEFADLLSRDGVMCYLADDGFVVYRWGDADTLTVDALVSGSEATTRTLWSVVGSGSSIARYVHAVLPPSDPVHLLLGVEAEPDVRVHRWMLRIIDVQAAVSARGWPVLSALQMPLVLDDPEIPDNAGVWHLTVADGQGLLTRVADSTRDALHLGARGLAALYSGTPMAALRRAGLATGGDPSRDDAIDSAFATAPAYMLHSF